ncbi:helix-turn-helix domain-containing protein [uncultured Pseudonocardia sp.]
MITHPGNVLKVSAALKADLRSPSALSALTGFSLEELRAYRNGWRVPSPGRLAKLAHVLDVPVSELL